jgi:hypothetical protein
MFFDSRTTARKKQETRSVLCFMHHIVLLYIVPQYVYAVKVCMLYMCTAHISEASAAAKQSFSGFLPADRNKLLCKIQDTRCYKLEVI